MNLGGQNLRKMAGPAGSGRGRSCRLGTLAQKRHCPGCPASMLKIWSIHSCCLRLQADSVSVASASGRPAGPWPRLPGPPGTRNLGLRAVTGTAWPLTVTISGGSLSGPQGSRPPPTRPGTKPARARRRRPAAAGARAAAAQSEPGAGPGRRAAAAAHLCTTT